MERIAMRRLGTAEDIADAVVYFASDLAGFVNGQVLRVDGGR
jgi:3-oxoacyl-[acyl-carrier protein] reductase